MRDCDGVRVCVCCSTDGLLVCSASEGRRRCSPGVTPRSAFLRDLHAPRGSAHRCSFKWNDQRTFNTLLHYLVISVDLNSEADHNDLKK